MEAFVKAESIKSKKIPLRFRCALAVHMGMLYTQIYEFDRAVEEFARGADFAKQEQWWSAYGEAVLNNGKIHTLYGRMTEAEKYERLQHAACYMPFCFNQWYCIREIICFN